MRILYAILHPQNYWIYYVADHRNVVVHSNMFCKINLRLEIIFRVFKGELVLQKSCDQKPLCIGVPSCNLFPKKHSYSESLTQEYASNKNML